MNKNKIIAIGIGASVLIGGIVFGITCVQRIKPGYVGVVYSPSSGVRDTVLTQGWKIVGPLDKVTKYSVATEQLFLSEDEKEGSKENDSFDVTTKDGKMNVDFEMSYSFDAEKVPSLYTKYRGLSGKEIVDTIIRGKIKTYSNEVTTQFTTLEAHMEKKAEVNKMLTEHLRKQLSEFGITVESANFTRTSVNEAVEKAITERSKASQELAAEKQKMEKAKLEAERKIVEAKGAADAKVIEAEGTAKANQKIQESLSKELIASEAIKKWNGSLVKVNGGDPIVDTREDKK